MNHRTLELPEPVYEGLLAEARARGITPADWITERLPSHGRPLSTDRARAEALERLRRCVVSSGKPRGADNDQIDADLIREYGNVHAPEPPENPPS